ncbi:MAG TPA: dihydropteroate synthase [Candidatus Eisenbacteria bacterium]|jgi:dihydropteroate synthase
MVWRCRERVFDLQDRVLVMGVLNVTPDSFSDGGRFVEPAAAIDQGRRLLEEGADLLDIGGESTRPGSSPVPAEEQWRRVGPVVTRLAGEGACVSIDTSLSAVAERAIGAGAQVVNDITALRDPAMGPLAARAGVGLVLMHLQGSPATMQLDPRYDDVLGEVAAALAERRQAARRAGVADENLALDPGIGFGKTLGHNLALLAGLSQLSALGRPLVVGVSRKSFLGKLLDLPVDQRLEAGLAAAVIAVFEGARIVRTHDVAPTKRATRVAQALRSTRAGEAIDLDRG